MVESGENKNLMAVVCRNEVVASAICDDRNNEAMDGWIGWMGWDGLDGSWVEWDEGASGVISWLLIGRLLFGDKEICEGDGDIWID